MNRFASVAKNSFFLLLTKIASHGLYFGLMIYLARYLGSSEFGKLAFAIAFATIIGLISDAGLKTYVQREVARNYEVVSKYVSEALLVKSSLSLITFILIYLIINRLGYNKETISIVYIIGLSVIINSFNIFGNFVFRAFERTEYELITSLIGRISHVGLTIVVLFFDLSLTYICLAFLGGALTNLFFCWYFLFKRITKFHLGIDISFWKLLIRNSWQFLLAEVFTEVYFRVDSVLLSIMKGDKEVGYYNAAYQLIEALVRLIPVSFASAMFPVLASTFVTSKKDFKNYFDKGINLLVILAFPFTIGTFLLSDSLIISIYGNGFIKSVGAIRILSFSLIFMFLNSLFLVTLCCINKQNIFSIITGVSAVVNIVSNLLLIPPLGYLGSSICTVLTEGVLFASSIWFVHKYISISIDYSLILKSVAGSIIMGYVVFSLHSWSILISILIGVIIYFFSLFLLNAFKEDEKKILSRIFIGAGKLK